MHHTKPGKESGSGKSIQQLSSNRRQSNLQQLSRPSMDAGPARDSKDVEDVADTRSGWLFKWTNYIKGYQKRWFILQNGCLSYYRNPNEVSYTCRGTINIANAFVSAYRNDATMIMISQAGTSQTFYLKAANEVERSRWLAALNAARSKSPTRPLIETDDDESEGASEAAVGVGGSPATRPPAGTASGSHSRSQSGAHLVGVAGASSAGDPNALGGLVGEHGQSAKLLKMKLDELATCFELLTRHLDALQQQGPGLGAVAAAEPDAAAATTGVLAPSISTVPTAIVTPLAANTSSTAATSIAPASAPAVCSGAAVVAVAPSVSGAGAVSSASSTLQSTAAAASPPLSRNFVDRAALYRLTAEAMHKACKEYLELATEDGQRWLRQFKKESTRRTDLEQQLETMAKQLRSLEKHAQKAYTLQRAAGGLADKASASASSAASGSGSTRLAVSGAGPGSAVIITQSTSSGGAGANGGANTGRGRSGGSRKRVPQGSTPQREAGAGSSLSSLSVHNQIDSPISPLAVTPIRTPPDQPPSQPQPQSQASPLLTSSSSSFSREGTSSLRAAVPGEQSQMQRLAVARLAPNVSMPSFAGLCSGSAGSTPSLTPSPSPSPSGSSNTRPAPFSAALDPPESTIADDDSDTEEEATPFYDATDLMPDENFLPSLPGSASAKHRMSPIPEPADAASDTTLVADMRHMSRSGSGLSLDSSQLGLGASGGGSAGADAQLFKLPPPPFTQPSGIGILFSSAASSTATTLSSSSSPSCSPQQPSRAQRNGGNECVEPSTNQQTSLVAPVSLTAQAQVPVQQCSSSSSQGSTTAKDSAMPSGSSTGSSPSSCSASASGSGRALARFPFFIEDLANPLSGPRRSGPRRVTIANRPSMRLNVWGIIKNFIGKDLSKVPLPVNFNEPISFLQRCVEDMHYHELLDAGAKCTARLPRPLSAEREMDAVCEQMAHVAAFSTSTFTMVAFRTHKPFNPLLGETYELDLLADEAGWRAHCEQVSHHPPIAALHTESRHGWALFQELSTQIKFRGKYLQARPIGNTHVEFREGGYHYTWERVPLIVNNIIVGKMWVDMSGEQVLREHKTGVTCIMKYFPYSYWSKDYQRKVMGVVLDARNKPRYMLSGHWDEGVEVCQVLGADVPALRPQADLNASASTASASVGSGSSRRKARASLAPGAGAAVGAGAAEDGEQPDEDDEASSASASTGTPVSQNGNVSFSAAQRVFQSSLKTAPPRISWKLKRPPENYENKYYMSELGMMLNEANEPGVSPTDCRFRPDQRALEEGEWSRANDLKYLLEEKQRTARRERERATEEALAAGTPPPAPYEPRWFRLGTDPASGERLHLSTGEYWRAKAAGDWPDLPDIYL